MTWTRLRRIFRPSEHLEAGDEIEFHIEMRTRELIEQGVDAGTARAMAEERFGPVRPVERAMTDSTRRRRQREDRAEILMNIQQDAGYALRALRKNPGFAAAAIATLALGVGATIAVFTVVNGVLIRPLPYASPSRIQQIWITQRDPQGRLNELPLTSGFYADIAGQTSTFEAIAAFRSWPLSLATTPGADPERVASARVSPGLFDVLGVRPMAGRAFTREHAVPGAPNVAVISHDLWRRRFGGDSGIVGRVVSLSGEAFTVTGVMPPGFAFPRGAELPAPFGFAPRTDVWTPLVFDSSDTRNYGTMNLSAVGRLRPGVDAGAARAELSAVMKRFLDANAPTLALDYTLVSLADQAGRTVKRGLLILMGAVVFVLLIASANVASLLIARVGGRRRELAVRAALGAGRGRIARQLVTENMVLGVLGVGLGVVVSHWATKFMLALVPGSLPRADDVGLDWRVLGVAAVLALVAGAVFGVAASASVSLGRIAEALHAGDGRSTGGLKRRYGRRALVTAEVALSVVLLIGAALLTRSFIELQRVRPGFDASGVLTAGVSLPFAGRPDPVTMGPQWSAKFIDIVSRLERSPGVAAAGAVSSLPLTGIFEGGGLLIVGQPRPEPGQGPHAQYFVVAGRYFDAARIALLAGRVLDSGDDAGDRLTIVVNSAFATKHFASVQDAIGRQVIARFDFRPDTVPHTIVGVVDNVKQVALDAEDYPQVYVPVAQMPYPGLTLVVRTREAPLALVPAIKSAVSSVDPTAMIDDVRTMEEVVEQSLARQRFSMTLIGTFALLALVLAIVGLYGVLALIVGQRRREIGVRLALGARPADVVRMIMAEGSRLAALGLVVGVAVAWGLTRVLQSLLYGVSTTDVASFAGAAVLVALVAVAATFAPARRAAAVDPKAALTAE